MKILIFLLSIFAAGLVLVVPAVAQTHPDWLPYTPLDPEAEGPEGIDLEVSFVGDHLFVSPVGSATDRWGAGLIDIAFLTSIWRGEAAVLMQARQGRNFGADAACAIQDISNIESRDFLQVSEYWWRRSFEESGFSLKVGKQDLNEDLCALDKGRDFLHSSFGVVPTIPIPTFPNPALGVMVSWDATAAMTFKAAVADGESYGGTCGFNSTFDGEGGLFGVVEAEMRLPESSDVTGVYRFGYWMHNGSWLSLSSDSVATTFYSATGWYLIADQQLWSARPGDEEANAVNLVLQLGRSPEDRIEVPRYLGAGITVTGVMGRIETFGLGMARVGVPAIEGWQHETAIEAYVRIRLTSQFTIQPDVQYIFNPGADGSGDILSFGFRFGFEFKGGFGGFG